MNREQEPILDELKDETPATDEAGSPWRSPWVHRWAVLLVWLTWPLIWVGGLVTTYDAGMAVPDWPATYGYNMFLYPWTTWLLGPFDLLIEHGHRLLASLVGLITIAMLVAAVWSRQPRWIVRLCIVALVGVILQGALGGARVVMDARTVAMIHGCFGPAFFVLCWMIAGVSSRWWQATDAPSVPRNTVRWGAALAISSYLQLVLGAQLRHMPVDAGDSFFRHIVFSHLTGAALVAVLAVITAWKLRRCGDLTLSRIGLGLIGLLILQWSLGLGTWFVNYGSPWALSQWPSLARYVIVAKGWTESMVVTGHMATGSLILALACWTWLRASRRCENSSFAKPAFD
ncbi:Heme A synthase [Rosistilla ulvae]|uniref:Heme A synthase n=1 Tax=Rosistilla ulvae TaxID=1930277 RepID=A0A517M3S0_9BACT|nr:COX15/CtaA family protein [Rosistilla ulvae]QDS89504.1 Heme A synthase [Rosistilla ulvae]